MFKGKIHVWPVHFKQKSMLIVLKYTLMSSLEKITVNTYDVEIDRIKNVNIY